MSATQVALILACCTLAIGAVVIVWRRGIFNPKSTVEPGANRTGEAAK